MIETIFGFLAACITIFIAGLLIKKQEKYHKTILEKNDKIHNSIIEISDEVIMLTNEHDIERNLKYLELRVDSLNKCLSMTKNPKRKRRPKNVKLKANFTDD